MPSAFHLKGEPSGEGATFFPRGKKAVALNRVREEEKLICRGGSRKTRCADSDKREKAEGGKKDRIDGEKKHIRGTSVTGGG